MSVINKTKVQDYNKICYGLFYYLWHSDGYDS